MPGLPEDEVLSINSKSNHSPEATALDQAATVTPGGQTVPNHTYTGALRKYLMATLHEYEVRQKDHILLP